MEPGSQQGANLGTLILRRRGRGPKEESQKRDRPSGPLLRSEGSYCFPHLPAHTSLPPSAFSFHIDHPLIPNLLILFSSPACALTSCKKSWGRWGCHVKQQKSFEWSESSFEKGAIDLELPSLVLWAGALPGIQVGRGTPSFSRWVKHLRYKQLFALESCNPHPS